MPGQPVCARARFQFPPAIHPRELPAAAGFAAIILRQACEIYHVFAEPTLGQNVATRNRKTLHPCAETVDDRTSLWMPEENQEGTLRNKTGANVFQQLRRCEEIIAKDKRHDRSRASRSIRVDPCKSVAGS